MRMHLSTTTSNSGGYSDLLYTLIRRAIGYQNAGEAHLERGPTTVLPENCALLLQEHSFYRNTVLQERSSTGTQSLQERNLLQGSGCLTKKGGQLKR